MLRVYYSSPTFTSVLWAFGIQHTTSSFTRPHSLLSQLKWFYFSHSLMVKIDGQQVQFHIIIEKTVYNLCFHIPSMKCTKSEQKRIVNYLINWANSIHCNRKISLGIKLLKVTQFILFDQNFHSVFIHILNTERWKDFYEIIFLVIVVKYVFKSELLFVVQKHIIHLALWITFIWKITFNKIFLKLIKISQCYY